MYWETLIKQSLANLERALEIAAQKESQGYKVSARHWLEMAEMIEQRIKRYQRQMRG